jgi:hypothetical protein
MKIRKFSRHPAVSLALLAAAVFAPLPASADIVTFHFTGRLTVAGSDGSVIDVETDGYTPISADLTLDTAYTGGGLDPGTLIGSSTLEVTVNDFFLGAPADFYDMTLAFGGSGVVGNFFVNWNGNPDIPVQVDWDVAGLTSAVIFGLQVGDTISGDQMSRDTDNDGIADTVVIPSLGSATPYADSLDYSAFDDFTPQGPAPMAATSLSTGVQSGAFAGIRGYVDIGSGNSMTVTSISSVPVPAAVWLFGSGLLALLGMARRRIACPVAKHVN